MLATTAESPPESSNSVHPASERSSVLADIGAWMPGTRRRILVVDDEPANLNLMRQILKGADDLAFARSGQDALDFLRLKSADLILLDVMMPSMDGYDVCAALKSDPRTRAIPVIFCTALSDSLDEVRGFNLGAVDYITKPVRPPLLHRAGVDAEDRI